MPDNIKLGHGRNRGENTREQHVNDRLIPIADENFFIFSE